MKQTNLTFQAIKRQSRAQKNYFFQHAADKEKNDHQWFSLIWKGNGRFVIEIHSRCLHGDTWKGPPMQYTVRLWIDERLPTARPHLFPFFHVSRSSWTNCMFPSSLKTNWAIIHHVLNPLWWIICHLCDHNSEKADPHSATFRDSCTTNVWLNGLVHPRKITRGKH